MSSYSGQRVRLSSMLLNSYEPLLASAGGNEARKHMMAIGVKLWVLSTCERVKI